MQAIFLSPGTPIISSGLKCLSSVLLFLTLGLLFLHDALDDVVGDLDRQREVLGLLNVSLLVNEVKQVSLPVNVALILFGHFWLILLLLLLARVAQEHVIRRSRVVKTGFHR